MIVLSGDKLQKFMGSRIKYGTQYLQIRFAYLEFNCGFEWK